MEKISNMNSFVHRLAWNIGAVQFAVRENIFNFSNNFWLDVAKSVLQHMQYNCHYFLVHNMHSYLTIYATKIGEWKGRTIEWKEAHINEIQKPKDTRKRGDSKISIKLYWTLNTTISEYNCKRNTYATEMTRRIPYQKSIVNSQMNVIPLF